MYAAPTADLSNAPSSPETITFALNGRIGRLRYLAYTLAMYFAISIATSLLLIWLMPTPAGATVVTILPYALYVAMGVGYTFIARRRLHDLDISGWFVLCLLIPFINLYFGLIMLFKRGDDGGNEFGARPSANSWGVKLLAIALPLIVFMIMVAAALIARKR